MNRQVLAMSVGFALLSAMAAPLAGQGGSAKVLPDTREIVRVDVFVQDATPIAAGGVAMALKNAGTLDLYNLDEMARLNDRLAVGLPTDEARASAMVAARVNELTEVQMAAYAHAANGQARANSFKIDRTPAVVINEKHVYYGATSIEYAIGAFRAGR